MIPVILLFSVISASVTWWLSGYKWIGPIRASAGSTLLALIDLHIINHFYPVDVLTLHAVIFGASFVGMSSNEKFQWWQITLAGFLFGLLFIWFVPLLKGMGGALGFSAFLSVSLSYLIKQAITSSSSCK